MTNPEFSDQFDTLVSSYANKIEFGDEASKIDFAFDEYEKSVWLTKAQEELVISVYSGTSGTSFEETEMARRYLANLVDDAIPTEITNSAGHPLGLKANDKFYTLPKDVWFIVYESINTSSETNACDNINGMEVVPVTHDEYHKIKKNPFRGANRRRALRLDLTPFHDPREESMSEDASTDTSVGSTLSGGTVEIISVLPISQYYIRYVRKPEPIILVNLNTNESADSNLTIEGKSNENPCKLHEALHRKILDRAVILALQSRGYSSAKSSK